MYQATVREVYKALGPLWDSYPAYTADLWSASEGTQYIAIQIHAVDKQFQYYMFSTGAVELPPPHTAPLMAEIINAQLKKFGFTPGLYKISATTYSGFNIHNACEEQLGHDWVPCILHIFHNVLGDLLNLDKYRNLLRKARVVCTMFRVSPAKWHELKLIQQSQIKEHHKIDSEQIVVQPEDDIDDEGIDISDEQVAKQV